MNERLKNIPASIHARLTNEAKKMRRPFGEILQYYGMERFLYRLSKTKYADSFVLKGGLSLYSWEMPLRRPTKDIDFLSLMDNRREIIEQVIKTALLVSVPEDGMNFDSTTLSIVETQVDADRSGIQAKFLGYLNKTRMPIHIDFGFSDELISEAHVINYPTLLHGMSYPQLVSYPIESVVAEKFHAMERFALLPSRWKDYYDIWLISEHFEFDEEILQKTIAKTFENRATALPSSRPIELTAEFAYKYDQTWKVFLENSGLKNTEINELILLVEKIWDFLEYPLEGLINPDMHRKNKRWMPIRRKWK
jgi:predicted nucleotidyltransferase component of viral defense system